MKQRINIVTLGCSKNRVDSETLNGSLVENGFEVEHDSNLLNFNYILINTCGFIGDAKEESINTILSYIEPRKQGKIDKIVVFGCLSERYKADLMAEIPEVDAWFGKFEQEALLAYLKANPVKSFNLRVLSTPKHFAYLKISEGCDRTCSFCAIPLITGKHISRPIESLVDEARKLAQQGVKELSLIAQDLSYYGLDLYKKQALASLLEQLAVIEGIKWIRLHYLYPAHFPFDILPVIRKYPNICNYIDIALQHISDPMLKAMRRNVTQADTYQLIETIRQQVPGIAIRTTLLVGHPGETETDFEQLKQFVKTVQFNRLGVFTYSHEEDTFAYKHFSDSIPEDVKHERLNQIMALQQDISLTLNQQLVGKIVKVAIDRKEGDYYIGRTEFDSPEVDNEVLITTSKRLLAGTFTEVEITGADEFDVYAKLVSAS